MNLAFRLCGPVVFLACLGSGVSLAAPASAVRSTIPTPPTVDARSWILMDHNTGKVLAEGNADLQTEPASITKIMTAYVAFHALKANQVKLEDEVLISEKAWRMGGSQTFIEVGKRVPFQDLLRGMIIQSGNDASVAVAEHVAGSLESFIDLMNQEAARLGMVNSSFASASGLTNGQKEHTSARDMAIVSSALIHEFPEYYPMFSEKEFMFNNIKQYNRNRLLDADASVDGLKTGYTSEAGYCLVASSKKGDTRMIAVVMGAKKPRARNAAVQSLLNYGMRYYETRKLYSGGKALKKPRVWKGDVENVPVGLTKDLLVSIPRGRSGALKATMEIKQGLHAPIKKGQKLGTVQVKLEDEKIAEAPVVALKAVKEGDIWRKMYDGVALWFN